MKTLPAGELAPDFTLPDHRGFDHRLSVLLAQGPVVLFFYPTAASSGCTKEACHFRDLAGEFAAHAGQRIGISMDDVSTQADFASQQSLDYPLLSDADGTVATAFGVRRRFITPVKRATFVIDRDGRIAEAITSETSMTVHADRALAALARLA
ncbi:MAG: peroxiredoxin [Actinomycetota bacterium]|nr:peroxiredoxin [Actinomycetota bacterium]